MTMVLLGSLTGTLLGWLMGFLSLFLIMLILIQRGKGGGLTGALGGPGGQSAFGSKAGDTFTVITIVVASLWGFTCALTMFLLGTESIRAVADEPKITAGPGDEEDRSNSMIIPPSGGLSGEADSSATTGETPSMELTPAVPSGDTSGAATEATEPAAPAEPAASTEPAAPAESAAPAEPAASTEPAVENTPADEPAAATSDSDK